MRAWSFGWVAAISFVIVGWMAWPEPQWPAGPVAPGEPEQGLAVERSERPTQTIDGFQIEGLAPYRVTALVLSVKDYKDEMATVVPRDVALGWGRMSDQTVIDDLSLSHGSRWYAYRWGNEGPPIPAGEIMVSSANTHLLVTSPEMRDEIGRIRKNDRVTLTGWLANVRAPQGHTMRSSMSRRDTGAGACEVLWVTGVEREAPQG